MNGRMRHAYSLDLFPIAERLELAGGVITNVAAAYLAAKEHGVVDGERLGRALRWELQKMGRWMGSDMPRLFALTTSGVGASIVSK